MKKLVDQDGNEIKVGDIVTTFRGEQVTVTLIRGNEGRNGRVYLRDDNGREQECFPGVISSHFINPFQW